MHDTTYLLLTYTANGQCYHSRLLAANVTRSSLTSSQHVIRCCYTDLSVMSGVSLTWYEEVNDNLRTCYEDVTRKLIPWNLA